MLRKRRPSKPFKHAQGSLNALERHVEPLRIHLHRAPLVQPRRLDRCLRLHQSDRSLPQGKRIARGFEARSAPPQRQEPGFSMKSKMACSTSLSIPRKPCGESAKQGPDRGRPPPVNMPWALRGAAARRAMSFAVSAGGLNMRCSGQAAMSNCAHAVPHPPCALLHIASSAKKAAAGQEAATRSGKSRSYSRLTMAWHSQLRRSRPLRSSTVMWPVW